MHFDRLIVIFYSDVEKKHVRAIMAALMEVGHSQLKKRGMFVLAGFAKFRVKHKKATKRRRGINPFTKEECWCTCNIVLV